MEREEFEIKKSKSISWKRIKFDFKLKNGYLNHLMNNKQYEKYIQEERDGNKDYEESEEKRKEKLERAYEKLWVKIIKKYEEGLKERRPHKKGKERYKYWKKRRLIYAGVLHALLKVQKEYEIPNKKLIDFFYLMGKIIPRWKLIKARELREWLREEGKKIPKWQRGPRASFLLFLFLDHQIYDSSIILVALEEGKSPRTIYEGIKKVSRQEKSNSFAAYHF